MVVFFWRLLLGLNRYAGRSARTERSGGARRLNLPLRASSSKQQGAFKY
jgi:hypothetical protein